MLSVDGIEEGLEQLEGLDLMLDSGAFRSISRGKELDPREVLERQERLVERLKALPVVYDYPLNPLKASERDFERSNEKTLKNVMLWSGRFGTSFLPVVHAPNVRLLRKYLKLYESMGFEKVALGSLALLSRYKPRAVLELVKVAREEFGRVHVLGVGNSLALAIAHLGLAESADSSSHLQDARYGMVRHPLDMSMVVVTERVTGKRREEERRIREACSCPACKEGGLGRWGRNGFLRRSVHNAYWLLVALRDRRVAERIISKRRGLWRAYLEVRAELARR